MASNSKIDAMVTDMVSLAKEIGVEVPGRDVLESALTKQLAEHAVENAGRGQPRHIESGKYLHHGAGTGKGEAHKAAQEGSGGIHRAPQKELPIAADDTENEELIHNPKKHCSNCGGAMNEEGECAGCEEHNEEVENATKKAPTVKPVKVTKIKGGGSSFTQKLSGGGTGVALVMPGTDKSIYDSKAAKTFTDKFAASHGGSNPWAGLPASAIPKGHPAPLLHSDHSDVAVANGALQVYDKSLTNNAKGIPMPFDHHQASKDAAAASLHADHDHAMQHSLNAVHHAKSGSHPDAHESHTTAAEHHEHASLEAAQNEDHDSAKAHDKAAGLHRKAASVHAHMHGLSQDGGGDQQGTEGMQEPAEEMEQHEEITNEDIENAKGLTMPKMPKPPALSKIASGSGAPNTRPMIKEAPKGLRTGGGPEYKPTKVELAAKRARTTDNVTQDFRQQAIGLITANCACENSDPTALSYLSDEMLYQLAANATAMSKESHIDDNEVGCNEEDDEDDSELENEEIANEDTENEATDNEESTTMNRLQSLDDIVANAEPELAETIQQGVETLRQQKRQLISMLVANVANYDRRKQYAQKLMSETINNLRERLEMQGAPNPVVTKIEPVYMGAGEYIANDSSEDDTVTENASDADMQPWPPVLNYALDPTAPESRGEQSYFGEEPST